MPTTNTLTQKVGGVLQKQTDIAISQAKLAPAKSLPISPKKTKQKQQQQQQILTSQQKQNKNSNKPEKIQAKVLNLQRNSQQQQQQVQKYKENTNKKEHAPPEGIKNIQKLPVLSKVNNLSLIHI